MSLLELRLVALTEIYEPCIGGLGPTSSSRLAKQQTMNHQTATYVIRITRPIKIGN